LTDTSLDAMGTQMAHELADLRASANMVGMPVLLIGGATTALIATGPLPPNLIWLCYLMPVIFATTRWGFVGAAIAAIGAGLAGDFFFTQPRYSLWMEDSRDVVALFVFLLAGFGSAVLITKWKQADQAALARREAQIADADQAPDKNFSYQWRTSLTTILGAANVLQMRNRLCPTSLDGMLLADINDEAENLNEVLTDFSASQAAKGRTGFPREPE
jgi:K+-sensing histidine kinase KdpD